MNQREFQKKDLSAIQTGALITGVVALLLCVGAAYFDRGQFFRSYLFAYVFWLGIPVGCLGMVMIHHLVGGTWGLVIQRPLESAIRTLPVMALLFLPILLGVQDLYPWAQPGAAAHDALLRHKSVYLNIPFFALRAILYFAVWYTVGGLLSRWSYAQDRTADPSLTQRLKTLSGPGLVLYGLTVTFSSIDWIMSLEPRWYSTIYGMIFMVSHGLVALAFAIGVVFILSRDRRPLSGVIEPWVFNDLGNLLLALVMLWAYTSFSQFLLVWVENLKNEIPWYLHRIAGGWGVIAAGLIVFQFALPFVLLLSRDLKRQAGALCAVASLIIATHFVEMLWFVAPPLEPAGFSLHWTDLLAPLGIGGLWLSAFLWKLKGRPYLPLHDPRFAEFLEAAQGANHG